jgi:uncharacterized membrane protein YbhN (UPF0104 family)
VLFALGHALSLPKCIIIDSLSMTARSVGFFIPGALGVQEVAFVVVTDLVGLSAGTGILLAIVKRLRDVAVGVPGLLFWQWSEGRRLRGTRRSDPAPSKA